MTSTTASTRPSPRASRVMSSPSPPIEPGIERAELLTKAGRLPRCNTKVMPVRRPAGGVGALADAGRPRPGLAAAYRDGARSNSQPYG